MDKILYTYKETTYDQLWSDFLQGDKTSFEGIYKQYIRDLLNYGYKVTSDRRLIEDSVQDLFFELWQSRGGLSRTTSIKFYLFRALRYKIVRNLKEDKIASMDSIEKDDNDATGFSHENYLIELESDSLQMTKLKDAIHRLPQRQQEAINLRYYHNFSNEEIAEIMGINYQSACKLIYSALKNLKLTLKPA